MKISGAFHGITPRVCSARHKVAPALHLAHTVLRDFTGGEREEKAATVVAPAGFGYVSVVSLSAVVS
jgi:hypothetical protein